MRKVASILIVALLACGTASAGPLLNHASAWNDGSTTWTGSTSFSNTAGTLKADIEWAVFAPGVVPFSDANLPAPAANEFLYTYQIENTGSVEINLFWVNMKPSNEAVGIGWFALADGIDPSNADWGNSDPQDRATAEWTFPSTLIAGEVSDGLAYSSLK